MATVTKVNSLHNTSLSNPAESSLNIDEKEDNHFQNQGIIDYHLLGRTPKKRRMEIVYLGKTVDPKLKILIMAGQHGDERHSRKATERLLTHLISTKVKEFPELCIAILPNANPDGSNKNTRNTGKNINLNRDHLLLASVENRLVHSFVQSWRPDIVIDVHTFAPEREYLSERGLVFYHDILIDGATNLGVRKKMDQDMLDNFINYVDSSLKPSNYSCARYVLIEPDGRIRNSTFDIEDARNFLSLRYDLLSILVEGREPISKDKEELEQTISSMFQALLSILKWSNENDKVVKNMKLAEYKKGDRIAIRYSSGKPTSLKMNFQDKATKEVKEIDFPTYTSNLKETRSIRLPSAYAIPQEKNKVIRLLHRQGFISRRVKDTEPYKLERYMVLTFTPSKSSKPRPPTDVRIISIEDKDDLSNYEIFPVDQIGGHILPLLLEPQSEYGLLRYNKLDLAISPGEHYAILRINDAKVNKLIGGDSEIMEKAEIS